jgi:hypothetical protein
MLLYIEKTCRKAVEWGYELDDGGSSEDKSNPH